MAGLERELAKRDMPEARRGDAWDYYETGSSPETATEGILVAA